MSDEGWQGPYARLHIEPPPAKTGYLANIGAGGNEAVASTLGLPVDAVTGGINLATRGINAATGTSIPPIVDPVGGSGSIKRAMGVIGANPDDVKAEGVGQEIARGVGGGVTSALIPAGLAAAAVRGGLMTAPTASSILSVAGDFTPQNTLLGGMSGGASEAAASQVPDQWKPLAGMAGGFVGVGIPMAGAAVARGAYRAAGDYLAPMWGRVSPLLDLSGDTILSGQGVPLNMLASTDKGEVKPLAATSNQARLAGQRLQGRASDPGAVRNTLMQQGPPVFAGNPTTPQLTGDTRLLMAERGISRTVPGAQAGFQAQAAGENDARVGMLRGVADGGDPAQLPAELQGQAAAEDAAAAARLEQIRRETAGDVAAYDAAGQAHVAGLQQTAEQTRAALGGNLPAGSEAQVGASVRAPVKAFDDAARARENAAWQAIDPEGKLAVDMRPVKEGAKAILTDRSPLAEPMAGKEAGIFDTVGRLRDVHSFKDLSALRQRLTDAIRQERSSPTGDAQAVRRMSILLGHVHDAMEGSVTDQNKVALLRDQIEGWHREADGASATETRNGGDSSGRNAPGGSDAVPPLAGSPVSSNGQSGQVRAESAGRRGGLSPGAANEVGPLPGSNRKPESLIDFLISKGGVRDQGGDLSAMDAQLVHQRGAGRLVNNTKGLSLDYAREAAAEAGFIRPNSTTNDLLDAISEHLSGNHRYRISEQEIGDRWGEAQRNTISHDEARYDAVDRVNSAAEDAGVRLTPAEREHAADLHMQGIHPDVAVQQAASAGESAAFDRNAAANAIGSPGVPLTARQADNGLNGTTRLEPNFDQAAADRYAEARGLTAARKGGFEGAPGVKSILQGGPIAGTFKMTDASVAASVIRVGPAGADHVRVYLAKGGSAEALTDAAAFSLRRDAMRPDGTLDPSRVAKWAKDRESFLSELPDAKAKFGAAADAQRAVEAGTKDAAEALKQATATAQRTVDQATAAQADAVKARQKSAVGKFLGEADPVTQVASILRSPTAVADMRLLFQRVKDNPDALAGLQSAVAEHILRDLKGDALMAGASETSLHGAQVQKFIRQREAALNEVLTPQQMTSLRNVAASLERSNLSVTGSKMAGGSDTMQIAAAGEDAAPETFLRNIGHSIGSKFGTGLGAVLGGMFGGPIGFVAGSAGGGGVDMVAKALRVANAAGLRTVNDLVANAMLNPPLAAVLLAKVTPENRASLGRALIVQLNRISLVSTAVGQQSKGRAPEQSRNTLLH